MTSMITLAAMMAMSPVALQDGKMKDSHMQDKMMSKKTIVALAMDSGEFPTAVRALDMTGLDEKLMEDGPYTIFVPSEEAFSRVPEKKLEMLMNDKWRLSQVLKYHVVNGNLMASDVMEMKGAKTYLDKNATLKFWKSEGGDWYVNDARIISTDMTADNGTVHVIDKVLMPDDKYLAKWPETRDHMTDSKWWRW